MQKAGTTIALEYLTALAEWLERSVSKQTVTVDVQEGYTTRVEFQVPSFELEALIAPVI